MLFDRSHFQIVNSTDCHLLLSLNRSEAHFVTLMLPIGLSVGVPNEWPKMIMKMRLFGLNQIQLLSRVLGTHLRTGFQPRPMPSIIIQMWLWTQS